MTDRKLSPAERAATEAVEPYVKAGEITAGEVDKILRAPTGFTTLARVVRANLASNSGSTWYYGARVREARGKWKEARQEGSATAPTARDNLMREEIERAVYLALRADYKTAEQIDDEDRYAPLFVTAGQVLAQMAEDDKAKQAGIDCPIQEPYWVEIVPVDGRTVARVGCECGKRHWDTVDLGPGATLEELDRYDYTILGPSKVLRSLGVRITAEFEQMPVSRGQAWRLRAPARRDNTGRRARLR